MTLELLYVNMAAISVSFLCRGTIYSSWLKPRWRWQRSWSWRATPLAWWRGRSSRAAQTKAKGECKQDIPTVSEIHKNYTLCYIISYPISCCVSTGRLPQPSSSAALWGRAVRWWQERAGLKCASCLMSIIRPWVRPDPASLWRSWDGKIFPLLARRSWRWNQRYRRNFPYGAIFGNTLFWLSLLSILLTRRNVATTCQ